jgi:hypothetical protein
VLTRGKENVLTLKSFISFLPPSSSYSTTAHLLLSTHSRSHYRPKVLPTTPLPSLLYKVLSIRLICLLYSGAVASRPIFCRFFLLFFYYDDHFFLLLHRIGGWEICYFIPLWNNFFPSSKPLFFL